MFKAPGGLPSINIPSTNIIDNTVSSIFNSAKNSDAAVQDSFLSNNDFMSYLQGLMAAQGQEAVETRLYNMHEAEKNRKWQEYMSNTAYQRAVADLQKAGLNPILAYDQGSATTPTGGSASASVPRGDTLSDVLNAFANLVSSISGGTIKKLLVNKD